MATDPQLLTVEEAKQCLSYDQNTGLFTRKVTGKPAGTLMKAGYLSVSINGKQWYLHRLAILLSCGRWPTGHIDHINGNRTDNRLENLRDCGNDPRINSENMRRPMSNNKLQILGVTKVGNRFQAAISIKGKQTKLGYFKTPEEAADKYIAAKRIHHAGCTI